MKLKIDLSKFKMKERDDKIATLVHPSGHEFRVAIKALHPENRKNLDAIKMANGGNVPKAEDEESAQSKLTRVMKSYEAASGGGATKQQPKPSTKPAQKSEPKKEPSLAETAAGFFTRMAPKKEYAEGGEVSNEQEGDDAILKEKYDTDAYNNLHEDEPKPYSPRIEKRMRETDVTPRGYYEGEEVEADGGQPVDPTQAQLDSLNQQVQQFAPQGGMPIAASPQALSQPMPQAPQPQSGLAQGLSTPQPQMAPQQDAIASIPGMPEQMAAVQANSRALSQQAEQHYAAESGKLAAQAKLAQDFQTHATDIQKEIAAVREDIAATHIDPSRLMGSKSTGERIAVGIGLFLGGLGGGISGKGGNAALDQLNKEIDRDIAAQKADLGKKETLLSGLYKQYGDLEQATNMARIIMNDQALSQVQMATAKATGQMAKNQGTALAGALTQQAQGAIQQAALQKTISGAEQMAKKDPSQYPMLIDTLAQIDPKRAEDMRQRLVPGVGLANTVKDAGEVKVITADSAGAKQAISELRQILNTPGRTTDLNTRARADFLRQQLMGKLRVPMLGPGTVNESEQKRLDSMIPDVAAIFSLDGRSATRLDALEQAMDQNVASQLSSRGIAGAVPSQTQEIKTVNGVRYTKGIGPDGRPGYVRVK